MNGTTQGHQHAHSGERARIQKNMYRKPASESERAHRRNFVDVLSFFLSLFLSFFLSLSPSLSLSLSLCFRHDWPQVKMRNHEITCISCHTAIERSRDYRDSARALRRAVNLTALRRERDRNKCRERGKDRRARLPQQTKYASRTEIRLTNAVLGGLRRRPHLENRRGDADNVDRH